MAGDFNIPRTRQALLSRVLDAEDPNTGLRIPYPPGTPTNYTEHNGRRAETEIDYILVSAVFALSRHHTVPGPSSHACVMCDFTGVPELQQRATYKRYRHPATAPETQRKLASLLALYWYWLRSQDVAPDTWIKCYWYLADPVLPKHNTRQATAECVQLGAALRRGGSQQLLEQWRHDLRATMFMRGLRLNKQIVEAASVTALTTKAMRLKTRRPQPVPELKSRPDHVARSTAEVLREVSSQLSVYQSSRGVLMNLPKLIWASATASPLPTPDEIDFATLMRARRHRDWDTDPDVRR